MNSLFPTRAFYAAVVAVVLGLLASVLVGVSLAMLGAFRPLPTILATVILWVVLVAVWRRGPALELPADSRPIVLALVVILAVTAINVRYSSQRVLTERDPGVYMTTARWLANEGTLLVDPQSEPYEGVRDEDRIHFRAAGYYEGHREDGKLYAQFVHGLPVLMAGGAWVVGSRGMMKVNALIGGLSLLLFFLFCTRLMNPWWAVAATAALGVNLPQMHFSRDAFSEVLTQLLVFGGLWVISLARPAMDPGRAAIGGLLLGATLIARVDAFVFLVPFAIYLLIELWSRPEGIELRRQRVFVGALAGGATVSVAIAWVDARYLSPIYLSDLWGSLRQVGILLIAVVVLGALVVFARPWLLRLTPVVGRLRPAAVVLVVAGVLLGAAYAFVLRPHVEMHVHADRGLRNFLVALQTRDGLPIDGNRWFSEFSFRWLALYLSIPTLFAGAAGCALMWADVVRGRTKRLFPFVLVFSAMSALYVWQPNVTPDHLWALRRFLPVTIPGLVLCAFWLMGRVWQLEGRWRSWAKASAALLALWSIAFPAWTLAPVWQERTQLHMLAATDELCRRLPDDAAVLVAQTQLLDLNYTQTVRAFCDVPAANAPMDQPMSWYAELARRWEREDRSLYVVAPKLPFGTYWPAAGARKLVDFSYQNLERTLRGRPTDYETYEVELYLMRVSDATRV